MRIFWFLCGGWQAASSRIHGYRVHDFLRRGGYASSLALAPPLWAQVDDLPWSDVKAVRAALKADAGDAVIFENLRGERAIALGRLLRDSGVRVLLSECDVQQDLGLAEVSDEIICASEALAEDWRSRTGSRTRVIEDPVESILPPEALSNRTRPLDRGLTIGWVGNYSHWATLDTLRSVLRRPEFSDFRLITVSDHEKADVVWSVHRAQATLAMCDLAVVPTTTTTYARAKSTNRVTQAMALGAPVIAGRIPSYEGLVQHGVNGFFAETADEWERALRLLRSPTCRHLLATAAHAIVSERFTISAIAPKWLAAASGCETSLRPDTLTVGPSFIRMPRALLAEELWTYARVLKRFGRVGRGLLYAIRSTVIGGRTRFNM